MNGINTAHLRAYVIRPALKHIELYSRAAENLVLGTALVESNTHHLRQVGGGPGRGLWQMEPATRRDIDDNYLAFRPARRQRVLELSTQLENDSDEELIGNLFYAAAMCRLHYRRVDEPLPAANDYRAMAAYWKQHYNTPKGRGTVERAIPFFRVACGD